MRDPDAAQAITAALWRAMLERGRGTVKQTEKAIGFRADGLRGAKNCKGGLRLRHVTDAIEALGIPPSVFFNDALGGGISTTAAERFMARGAELAVRNLVELPDLADDVQPDRLTEDDLARLDAARFEDPHAAADQAADIARQAARDGRRGDAVVAVARQGSALRVAEEWEPAWVCVWWALRHASDGPIKADALMRAGYVISEYGEFSLAAELAGEAAIRYMKLGCPTNLGRAMVDQGIFARRSSDYEQAIELLEAALVFLPKEEVANRFSAHLSIGLAFARLKKLRVATHHADKAEAIVDIPAALSNRLPWLRARIAAGNADYSNAIEQYRRTLHGLRDCPANGALAAAELCCIALQAKRPDIAVQEAVAASRLAVHDDANPIVSAALVGLYRSAHEGALTLKVTVNAVNSIRQGLRRRAH